MFPNTDKMHYRAMQNPSGTDAHSNCDLCVLYFLYPLSSNNTNNKKNPQKTSKKSGNHVGNIG